MDDAGEGNRARREGKIGWGETRGGDAAEYHRWTAF